MSDSRRRTAKIGFLRIYAHEWSGQNAETFAQKMASIVQRRVEHAENSGAHQWVWVITDAHTDAETKTVRGVLRKLRATAIEERFDRKSWSLKETSLKEAPEAESAFLIDPTSHIIAHQIDPRIQQKKFRDVLRTLMQKDGGFAPALNPLSSKQRFITAVRSMEHVTRIAVKDVTKSNPIDSLDWKKGEQWLDEIAARKVSLTAENEDGVTVDREGLLSQLMSLAERGYGEAEATGRYPGEAGVRRLRTYTTAIEKHVNFRRINELWGGMHDSIMEVSSEDDAPVTIRPKQQRRSISIEDSTDSMGD